jgi:hypothetical protein
MLAVPALRDLIFIKGMGVGWMESKILLGALNCRGTRTVRASAKSKIHPKPHIVDVQKVPNKAQKKMHDLDN